MAPKCTFTEMQFLKAWLDSTSATEVAETLGISRNTVYNFAARLRDAGVELPKHVAKPQGHGPVDVAALNAVIKTKGRRGG